MPKATPGPMTKGIGYVFETETLNYGGAQLSLYKDDNPPNWVLKISAAGTFRREDVTFIRDALTLWLNTHA